MEAIWKQIKYELTTGFYWGRVWGGGTSSLSAQNVLFAIRSIIMTWPSIPLRSTTHYDTVLLINKLIDGGEPA
jgi:hypothetical protein